MGIVFEANYNNNAPILVINKPKSTDTTSHKRPLKPLTLRNRIFLNTLPQFTKFQQ